MMIYILSKVSSRNYTLINCVDLKNDKTNICLVA